jgi:hypothetical protein
MQTHVQDPRRQNVLVPRPERQKYDSWRGERRESARVYVFMRVSERARESKREFALSYSGTAPRCVCVKPPGAISSLTSEYKNAYATEM